MTHIKPLLFFIVSLILAQTVNAFPTETRFGTLDEVIVYFDDNPTQRAHNFTRYSINSQEIEGLRGWFNVAHIFEWGGNGDVVLLTYRSGGASCCTSYRLLHLTENGYTLGPVFGKYGRDPSAFIITTDEISFRMERDFPPDIDHWEFHYDGESITLTEIMENNSSVEPAGTGEAVTRLQNLSPSMIFDDAAERVRFLEIMENEHLNNLRTRLLNGMQNYLADGYLIAWGCQPHRCGLHNGYIAIEVETGQPFAAYSSDNGLTTFGANEEMLPAPMLNLINEQRERTAGD